jgi:hypothetical protein
MLPIAGEQEAAQASGLMKTQLALPLLALCPLSDFRLNSCHCLRSLRQCATQQK